MHPNSILGSSTETLQTNQSPKNKPQIKTSKKVTWGSKIARKQELGSSYNSNLHLKKTISKQLKTYKSLFNQIKSKKKKKKTKQQNLNPLINRGNCGESEEKLTWKKGEMNKLWEEEWMRFDFV